MNSRSSRNGPSRSGAALIHRGPQALSAPHAASANYVPPMHAPNAALLIDFDNVTMGIRSDLGKELRTLLGSDIIKGKVAGQRAYADWRRYPQYIVPLAESSIDMIMAPAYGSSKKNATDIRLAVDAMELVFTRPEIGTYILLSGDSDFASLVTKLKEYGKYVIGVGIRESSSDLLVMNCDEYYSYNALAGLVKNSEEEEAAKKWDPWELVTEAVSRMKRNGDVMRSDRLKQVMQEIDGTFDEKDLGMAKFSRFVQDAVQRGLLSATKLENGQLEIGLPSGARGEARAAENAAADEAARGDGPRAARTASARGAADVAAAAAVDAIARTEVRAPTAQPPSSRSMARLRPCPRRRRAWSCRRRAARRAGPRVPERSARPERQERPERAPRAESGEQIGITGERPHARRGVRSRAPLRRDARHRRRGGAGERRPRQGSRPARSRQREPQRSQLPAHPEGRARQRCDRSAPPRRRLRDRARGRGGFGLRPAREDGHRQCTGAGRDPARAPRYGPAWCQRAAWRPWWTSRGTTRPTFSASAWFVPPRRSHRHQRADCRPVAAPSPAAPAAVAAPVGRQGGKASRQARGEEDGRREVGERRCSRPPSQDVIAPAEKKTAAKKPRAKKVATATSKG
jgi:uncharacterized LabA/DUF88 family protein